jgi:hypothetical protein
MGSCPACGWSKASEGAAFVQVRLDLGEPPELLLCMECEHQSVISAISMRTASSNKTMWNLSNASMFTISIMDINRAIMTNVLQVPQAEVGLRLNKHMFLNKARLMDAGKFEFVSTEYMTKMGCYWRL